MSRPATGGIVLTRHVAAILLLLPLAAAADEGPRYAVHETDDGPQLLGAVTRADIAHELPGWDLEYDAYAPAPELVAALAAARPAEIVCVLGTWCHDSEREVPRFWKALDAAGNDGLALTMIAVGRTSDAEAGARMAELGFAGSPRDAWDARYVPTFVVRRDGRELGRIVETPETSLEADLAAILARPVPGPSDTETAAEARRR